MGSLDTGRRTNARASWGSVMRSRPYCQQPARTVSTLGNRMMRLMDPPEKTLMEKVESLGNLSEQETPFDPLPLLLYELRRFDLTRCGAKTRAGHPCRRKALRNGRCRNHGGLSTGPRTPEGQLRALLNLRQFRAIRTDALAALKR